MIHVTNGTYLQESTPTSRSFNFQAIPNVISRNIPFPIRNEGGVPVAENDLGEVMPFKSELVLDDCTFSAFSYRWVLDPQTVHSISSVLNTVSGWYSLVRDGRTFGVPHYSRTPFRLGFRIENFTAHFKDDGTLYFGGTGIRMGYFGTTDGVGDPGWFFVPEFQDGGASVTNYEIILETQNKQQTDYLYTVTGGET